MNRKRLRILEQYLRRIPRNKFDISSYVSECGTTACAIGHAYNIPSFKRDGFEPRNGSFPGFGGLLGTSAIGKFFELDKQSVYSLFMPSGYNFCSITPIKVANKINTLLKKH